MTGPVRVGHIDLSFHDAAAGEVERILIAHGHEIERTAAPHEELFGRMGRGEVDVLVSAWLPTSHGRYLAPIADNVHEVTVLYEPYCIWAYPISCRRRPSARSPMFFDRRHLTGWSA